MAAAPPPFTFAEPGPRAVLFALAAALLLLLLWWLADVWLLVFGGILFACALRGAGAWLADGLPGPVRLWTGLASALALLTLLGALVALGPAFLAGLEELRRSLPGALERLRSLVSDVPWLDAALERSAAADSESLGGRLLQRSAELFSTAFGVLSGMVGALAGVLVICAIAVYGALSPAVYVHGFCALLPPAREARAREVLGAIAHALRWWLVGRLASMALVGVLTWAGLALLGIPSPVTLGMLAGLLSFIPNLGPILSVVPALVVALTVSFDSVLYVALLYLGVQTVESYLVTPLIQQRAVALPPALLFSMQLALGAAFGLLGLLFATPLTVAAIVTIRLLWVEGRLGRDTEALV